MKKYYVYLYMREDLYSPYYVGSGSGGRCFYYHKNMERDRIPPKDRNLIRKVYEGEEKECRELESILILFYGLKSEGGILDNKKIDSCGIPLIEEYQRRRLSEYYKKYQTLHKEKYEEYNKEYYSQYYEKNKEKVKERSSEYYYQNKEKVRERNKGRREERNEYQREYRRRKRLEKQN